MWHAMGKRKVQIDIRLESMKEENWWICKALLATKYLSECLE